MFQIYKYLKEIISIYEGFLEREEFYELIYSGNLIIFCLIAIVFLLSIYHAMLVYLGAHYPSIFLQKIFLSFAYYKLVIIFRSSGEFINVLISSENERF